MGAIPKVAIECVTSSQKIASLSRIRYRCVWLITGRESEKGRALAAAGRFALCAQSEAPPLYQYVSVEGPVVSTRPARLEEDRRPMARRYFGRELGDRYVESSGDEDLLVFTMRPERWRTVDYRKSTNAAEIHGLRTD